MPTFTTCASCEQRLKDGDEVVLIVHGTLAQCKGLTETTADAFHADCYQRAHPTPPLGVPDAPRKET